MAAYRFYAALFAFSVFLAGCDPIAVSTYTVRLPEPPRIENGVVFFSPQTNVKEFLLDVDSLAQRYGLIRTNEGRERLSSNGRIRSRQLRCYREAFQLCVFESASDGLLSSPRQVLGVSVRDLKIGFDHSPKAAEAFEELKSMLDKYGWQ